MGKLVRRSPSSHPHSLRLYRRKNETGPERIKSRRRAQVKCLVRDRHGKVLRDDHCGRAVLQILFELGLTGPEAQRLAPWADGQELERLIRLADSNCEARVGITIADRLEVTFAEYRKLALWHLGVPIDVSPDELDSYRADRRRQRDRARKRRMRAEQAAMRPSPAPSTPMPKASSGCIPLDPWDLPDERAKALACVPLNDGKWWSVRALADYSRDRLGAFLGLDHSARRQAVLRAVRKLEVVNIVETKSEPGPRGLPVLYARRLITAQEETELLMEEVAAEQAPELELLIE